MQFAPHDHGNSSQHGDGRSIPRPVTSAPTNPGGKVNFAEILQLFCKKLGSGGMKMQHSPNFLCSFLPWLRWVSANLSGLPPFCLLPVESCFFPLENFNSNKPIAFGRAASGGEGDWWHWGPGKFSWEEKLGKSHHPSQPNPNRVMDPAGLIKESYFSAVSRLQESLLFHVKT